jgi:hypothetical protein
MPPENLSTIPMLSVIELRGVVDGRGHLSVIEHAELGFEIQRVYFISQVPPAGRRGGHAHRRVVELLVAAAGAFAVACDDGERRREFQLAGPRQALLVPPLVWRELTAFAPGSMCLVLASEGYDEHEYLRTRSDFHAALDEGNGHVDPSR